MTLLASALCAPKALGQVTNHESQVTHFAPVVPGYQMQFPRDEGSHPDFRIEWWYVTGWLDDAARPLGFQITFFRARPELKHENPSAFSPRQIIIAHAALSDPSRGRLIHSQRAARAGFELAGADRGGTHVWVDDWSLRRTGATYRASIPAREFSLELDLAPTQQPMLQGQDGYSRKGPARESASYYYSLPHLEVTGTVARGGKQRRMTGAAWLDHEWSSQYMQEDAAGWDWIGINLDDGGALMAFRMRATQGGNLWAGGAVRDTDGRLNAFPPDKVSFIPRREWQSARTGIRYPVSFVVRAGDREITVEPLFDDQEHDTRTTTGAIYWEGAVFASTDGKPVGRGYLELTGYGKRLVL